MKVTQKQLKTCLRYPGGKSRACVKMDPYFPDLRNYKEFRESFLGGGSVAIHITKKYPHLDIWVNDLYEPLVNFWQQLQMFG
ncbi:MAG: Synechococcus phage Bellamy, partial [Bacteroidota bacterium]